MTAPGPDGLVLAKWVPNSYSPLTRDRPVHIVRNRRTRYGFAEPALCGTTVTTRMDGQVPASATCLKCRRAFGRLA